MSRGRSEGPRSTGNAHNAYAPPAGPAQGYSNHYSGVPFKDADGSTDEAPLDALDCFVVPANDDSGHSERFQFRLTPYLLRCCKLLVHCGRFPYLDVSDLMRHAVMRHVSWLIGLRHSIPKHPRVSLAAMEEIAREEEWRIKAEEVFNRIMSLVTYYMGRGDTCDALRLISVLQSRLSNVEHNGRSREFAEKFHRAFAHHLMPGGQLNMASPAQPQLTFSNPDMDVEEVEAELIDEAEGVLN